MGIRSCYIPELHGTRLRPRTLPIMLVSSFTSYYSQHTLNLDTADLHLLRLIPLFGNLTHLHLHLLPNSDLDGLEDPESPLTDLISTLEQSQCALPSLQEIHLELMFYVDDMCYERAFLFLHSRPWRKLDDLCCLKFKAVQALKLELVFSDWVYDVIGDDSGCIDLIFVSMPLARRKGILGVTVCTFP